MTCLKEWRFQCEMSIDNSKLHAMTEETTPKATFRDLDSPLQSPQTQARRSYTRFAVPEADASTSMRKTQTAPSTPELHAGFLGHRRHGSASMLRSNPTRTTRANSLLALSNAGKVERGASSFSLADTDFGGLTALQTTSLIEIQRVLYHGGRGLARKGKDKERVYTRDQVAEVVERYLDSDCTYESPFVSLPTRSLVYSFFHVGTILSQILLPSFTPWAIFHHLKSAASLTNEKELETESHAWWRAWDVWGDCGEIGGMECFDGFHLGLIDQTINLHLLPHLLPTTLQAIPNSPELDPEAIYAKVPSSSNSLFYTALSHVLRFEIRIMTVVEFNESGKVTYMRDLVDLREVFEAIVPFGRSIGWVARRATGLLSAGLNTFLETLRPKQTGKTSHWPPKNDEEWSGWQARMNEVMDTRRSGQSEDLSRTSSRHSDGVIELDLRKSKSKMSRDNMLGLSSDECAPGVDSSTL